MTNRIERMPKDDVVIVTCRRLRIEVAVCNVINQVIVFLHFLQARNGSRQTLLRGLQVVQQSLSDNNHAIGFLGVCSTVCTGHRSQRSRQTPTA